MKQYRYHVKYQDTQRVLCMAELWALTGREIGETHFSTDQPLPPQRCTFVQNGLMVWEHTQTIEEAMRGLRSRNLADEAFKCVCLDYTGKIGYTERRAIEYEMGQAISGTPDIHAPRIVYALWAESDGVRIGRQLPFPTSWRLREQKPWALSIALPVSIARVAVNLAAVYGTDLVDPCCGVGTVPVEAAAMGLQMDCFDLNEAAVAHTNDNLRHFNLPPIARLSDIAYVPGHYDAAVVDVPYGRFSIGGPERQCYILESAAQLADTVILITMDDPTELLDRCGMSARRRFIIPKSRRFARHITICQ